MGQVQIPKTHANIAKFRILTLTVDGRRQTLGAAYYDIPLKKFLNKAPMAASSRIQIAQRAERSDGSPARVLP